MLGLQLHSVGLGIDNRAEAARGRGGDRRIKPWRIQN